MNLPVDLNGLTRPARAFLRAVADFRACNTRLDHVARKIAGRYLGFRDKSSARTEANIRRKLRGRQFVITTPEEVAVLQTLLDRAVEELAEYERRGRTLPVERELHRFARSLHLSNILEMWREEVA